MRQEVYTKFAAAIDGRVQQKRAEAEAMRKRAALTGVLQRLAVGLNPRVSNPRLLKLLSPFIKSKTVRTGIKGTPEEVSAILKRVYQGAGMPAVGGAASSVSGGGSVGATGNIAEAIANGAAYKTVSKNRLSLGRLAGTVGAAGAAGAGAAAMTGGKSAPQPEKSEPVMLFLQRLMQNPRVRNSLIGAGIGGLGTAALSGGSATSRILKGLAGAAVAGGATYAAPKIIDYLPRLGNGAAGK